MLQKADVGSLIGVVSSSILSALSFIYELGVFQFLFPYLVGAFTTYFVQHRLQMATEKRERKRENYNLMRERIYGPMLQYVNFEIDHIKEAEDRYRYNLDKEDRVKAVLSDHLFFSSDKEVKEAFPEIVDRIEKYRSIHSSAESRLCEILREKGKDFFKVDEHNPANSFVLRLDVSKRTYSTLFLLKAVFLKLNPKDFLEAEKNKWGLKVPFELDFSPPVRNFSISKMEDFYNLVLEQTKKEQLFMEERNQRLQLLKQLEDFSEKLEPYINLENS